MNKKIKYSLLAFILIIVLNVLLAYSFYRIIPIYTFFDLFICFFQVELFVVILFIILSIIGYCFSKILFKDEPQFFKNIYERKIRGAEDGDTNNNKGMA